jgi:hypothetical protein
MRRFWLTVAPTLILIASPARAQDIGTPRVELGANLSVVAPLLIEDGPFVVVGGGPRVAVHLTRRLGIEGMADVLGPVESANLTGLYMTQLTLRLRESKRARTLLLTIGTAGGVSYSHFGEQRSPRLDGSIAVHPGYRRLRVQGPNTVTAGIERTQGLGRYGSGSLALQAFIGPFTGVAVRAAAGMSFGLGRRR